MAANFTHRDTLLDLYQQLQDHPYPGSNELELAALAGEAQRLRGEVFTIAFIGRFSVGKSQLINCLFLGEEVLTVNLKPTTAHLMRIGYGPQPALWLLPSAEGDAEKPEGLKPEAPGTTGRGRYRHQRSDQAPHHTPRQTAERGSRHFSA
jgi:hypothetical protein